MGIHTEAAPLPGFSYDDDKGPNPSRNGVTAEIIVRKNSDGDRRGSSVRTWPRR